MTAQFGPGELGRGSTLRLGLHESKLHESNEFEP
jgi:hypothetical protein